MVEIDGSFLEGGGAILRVAAALSAITGKPLRVYNIRAKRRNPGLRTQHLEGLKAISTLCSGRLINAALGSTEIELVPGQLSPKKLNVEISTAGSVGLLFQSLCVPMSMAGGEVSVSVKGGATFAMLAPSMPYLQNVLLAILVRMGYRAEIHVERNGFYPVGGSRVKIRGYPCEKLLPLNLTEAGTLGEITGVSLASTHLQKARVADRQGEAARKILESRGIEVDLKIEYVDAASPGSGVALWGSTSTGAVIGADSLGQRGKPAETVGKEAADTMVYTIESGAAVDEHLSDQLLIFMALSRGRSNITAPSFTNHAKTNIHIIKEFLPVDFTVTEAATTAIECSGLE